MKAQKKMPRGCLEHSRRAVLNKHYYLMKAKQMNTNKQQQDQQTEARGAA